MYLFIILICCQMGLNCQFGSNLIIIVYIGVIFQRKYFTSKFFYYDLLVAIYFFYYYYYIFFFTQNQPIYGSFPFIVIAYKPLLEGIKIMSVFTKTNFYLHI